MQMRLPPLRVVTRLTENVHILSVCADYLQISGYRRGKYGHLTEIYHISLTYQKKN